MRTWIEEENKHVKLKDKRLEKRMIKLTEDFTKRPEASIPQSCGNKAATNAAYEFFDNDRIEVEEIKNSMIEATIERVKQSKERLLVVHDTTEINLSHLTTVEDLGVLSNPHVKGLHMHTAMVVTEDGLPLGIIHQEIFKREKPQPNKKKNNGKIPIEDKESFKWIKTLMEIEWRIPKEISTIIISDSESDMFELFAFKRRKNNQVLVRSCQDRNVIFEGKQTKLRGHLKSLEAKATIEITLPRRYDHTESRATIEIRYSRIEIVVPENLKSRYSQNLKVDAVYAKEIQVPEGRKAIEWYLLSSIEVNSAEEAIYLVKLYTRRWIIERYHYVLKSGCRVEKLQLESPERIKKAFTIYTIVAWRIMYMTYLARVNPDESSSEILEEDEWKVLCMYTNKKIPEEAPTVYQAVRMIALMGGFLGRKSDGPPGPKVIWRGLRRLNDMVEFHKILKKDVGNE
jgi:hypothetical protein